MAPTGKKNQPNSRYAELPTAPPMSYATDSIKKYYQLPGVRYAHVTPKSINAYDPHSIVTPTFTPHNHPLPFATTTESVARTPAKVSEKPVAGLCTQNGIEIYDFHETWKKELEKYKHRMKMQTINSQHRKIEVRSHRQSTFPHVHGPKPNQFHHLRPYQQEKQKFDQFQIPLDQNKNRNNFMASVKAAQQYCRGTTTANVRAKVKSNAKAVNSSPKAKTMGTCNIEPRKIGIGVSAGVKKSKFLKSPKNSHGKQKKLLKQQQQPQEPLKPLKQATKKDAGTTTTAKEQRKAKSVCQLKSAATEPSGASSSLKVNQKQQSPNRKKSPSRQQLANKQQSSKSQSPRNKMIVNQYHARHLLSTQSNKKTKVLEQKRLTKSAASTYASTLYAKAFKQSPTRTLAPRAFFPSDRSRGVSLVAERFKAGRAPSSDDPCTAIDEVNDFSASTDNDEEYTGEPFYLPNEPKNTQQSQCIRYQPEKVTKSEEDKEQPLYYKPTSILTASLFPNVPPYLNFSCHKYKGPSVPPAVHKVLKWKFSAVMPKIIKRIVLNTGFRIIKNTTDWIAVWERHMKGPGFQSIRTHQKYNHMPGSVRIGRKDTMWQCINKNIQKFGIKEFGFMQISFVMPKDLKSLRKAWPKNATLMTKWIVKPPARACGTGIRIVNKWSQFPKDRPVVVQKYIEKPLLINDNKFDMRIYVAVTSIDPLRIYMYKDGLARFAAVKYNPKLDHLGNRCMHLTNYSINKFSANYTKNEDFNLCQGHKWTLQSLWSCLEARKVNTKRLWATLRNLVIKAIISGEAGVHRVYSEHVKSRYNCFELFGFDILLDENLVPWLLEVNISPSMHSELPLDLHVKGPLLQAVLNTALYQIPPKLSEKAQNDIREQLNLSGPICQDKRIFSTHLTAEEARKHYQFTHPSLKSRKDYLNAILDNLLPDDVRCLIISEDELARCNPLERIFPTIDSHKYIRFIEETRYYNRLMDAWEHKYGHNRKKGIKLLRSLCEAKTHLQVSDKNDENEVNVAPNDIDMLHVKKDDESTINIPANKSSITKSKKKSKSILKINVAPNDIDMLHVKKDDESTINIPANKSSITKSKKKSKSILKIT